jgi:hypothetical protein
VSTKITLNGDAYFVARITHHARIHNVIFMLLVVMTELRNVFSTQWIVMIQLLKHG